jgi:epidermal growth factor receptor substrate 15
MDLTGVANANIPAAAPLPKFEGLNVPAAPPAAPQGFSPQTTGPLQPQISGQGPIRVPPLTPAKASEYAGLFEKSGAVNGVLSGMLLFDPD